MTKAARDSELLKNSGRADRLKELGRVNETGTVLFRAGKWCKAGENLPNIVS